MLDAPKRIVYKLIEKEWIEISFNSLRQGDIFMLFEPFNEKEPVKDRDGRAVFIAKSDACDGGIQI